jgi:quinol monooxygenase YgiN
MVKHIVMWKLAEQAEGRDRAGNAARIKAELEALRGRIPGLLAIEVGVNVDRSDAAYDLVLYSEFTDEAALQAYQVHPEHQKVAAFIGKVRTARVLVDYVA